MKIKYKATNGEMEKPVEPELNLTKILMQAVLEEGEAIFIQGPEQEEQEEENQEEPEDENGENSVLNVSLADDYEHMLSAEEDTAEAPSQVRQKK